MAKAAVTRSIRDDHQKNFLKIFNGLTGKHSRWEIWEDFVTLTAIEISNSTDKVNATERTKMYQTIISKYSAKERDGMAEMLAEVVMGMEQNPDQDFLGSLYMMCELGNDHAGQFFTPIDGATILKRLEQCGRVCYKSEDKITEGSAEKFVAGIIKRGHEAVLEHCSFTVKFICDRGVSHEIVRHRMASYCQESTRYCNYGKGKFGEEITVIEPCFWPEGSDLYWAWKNACLISEQCYFSLLKSGATPQEARSVLPNSLKTEVVMTANIREWRHFLKLRCSPAAHPQMREVALILLDKVHALIPVCFDDIWSEYHADV